MNRIERRSTIRAVLVLNQTSMGQSVAMVIDRPN